MKMVIFTFESCLLFAQYCILITRLYSTLYLFCTSPLASPLSSLSHTFYKLCSTALYILIHVFLSHLFRFVTYTGPLYAGKYFAEWFMLTMLNNQDFAFGELSEEEVRN